jgi:hypothetical protein
MFNTTLVSVGVTQSFSTSITFQIAFDVDRLQYNDAAQGYSQMTTLFTSNAASGGFNMKLQTNAAGLASLLTVKGTSTAMYSTYWLTFVQLRSPSMQPSISVSPSVTPTQQPTTRTPTLLPTTTDPTMQPTTPTPTFAPTFKTCEFV